MLKINKQYIDSILKQLIQARNTSDYYPSGKLNSLYRQMKQQIPNDQKQLYVIKKYLFYDSQQYYEQCLAICLFLPKKQGQGLFSHLESRLQYMLTNLQYSKDNKIQKIAQLDKSDNNQKNTKRPIRNIQSVNSSENRIFIKQTCTKCQQLTQQINKLRNQPIEINKKNKQQMDEKDREINILIKKLQDAVSQKNKEQQVLKMKLHPLFQHYKNNGQPSKQPNISKNSIKLKLTNILNNLSSYRNSKQMIQNIIKQSTKKIKTDFKKNIEEFQIKTAQKYQMEISKLQRIIDKKSEEQQQNVCTKTKIPAEVQTQQQRNNQNGKIVTDTINKISEYQFPYFHGNIFTGFKSINTHQQHPDPFIPQYHLDNLREYRNQLIKYIQDQTKMKIRYTKLRYQHDENILATKIHKYIDDIPDFVVIIQLKNSGRLLGAYSREPLRQKNCHNTGDGFLFSLENKKIYKVQKRIPGAKFLNYDPYYISFGNSELRIQMGKQEVFSNFGIAHSFFRPKDPVIQLFGVDEKIVAFEQYEIHQIFFH